MARAACAVRVTRWVQGPRYHEGEVSTLQQVWAVLEHGGARLRVPGGGTVPPPVQVELRRGRHLSESHSARVLSKVPVASSWRLAALCALSFVLCSLVTCYGPAALIIFQRQSARSSPLAIGRPDAEILNHSPPPAYARGQAAVGGAELWPRVQPGVLRGLRAEAGL